MLTLLYTAMIPLWSIPVATITGNCLIIKPSERDPGAAMILAELAQKAGFPDGVVNIVHGAAKTVDFIIDEPAIKAISFVGSNRAGEYIFARGSAQGKRVQANLGAKNHAAILPDCNKNHALNAIVGAAFGAAGQRCMALSTIVTVGEADKWLPEIAERAKELSTNGGFEEGADLGPVISPQSKERIEKLIASAEEEGATILLDGRNYKPKDPKYANGNWVSPSPHPPLHKHLKLTLSHSLTGWPDHNNQCQTTHEMLYRRDLRPSPRRPLGLRPRKRHLPNQRQRIRQRRRNLHPIRRHRRPLPARHRSRPGRNQRAHPGPIAHVQFYRQQEECCGWWCK